MAAIPFSLVGILPAHAAMGAFFTATSMIGFIAGAGIVVRNSIILVDFIELRLRDGVPLEQAVVDAGAVRFRPDGPHRGRRDRRGRRDPVRSDFPGAGHFADGGRGGLVALSRMAVPVLYYLSQRGQSFPPMHPHAPENVADCETPQCEIA